MIRCVIWMAALAAGFAAMTGAWSQPAMLDISDAVIVSGDASPAGLKTVAFLRDEIAHRTGLTLDHVSADPEAGQAAIVIASDDAAASLEGGPAVPDAPEGFALWADSNGEVARVHIAGRDGRGALFGVGRLLRTLHMTPGVLQVPADLRIATAPDYPVRGHQLGYRGTANSYDRWGLAEFEQYIRDLVVFGTNAIELIPPTGPGTPMSPHMTVNPWEMTIALSALLDEYNLDTWLWVPVRGDVAVAEESQSELADVRALFTACPRIDGVFVPGGDPGHTEPAVLMPFLERMAAELHAAHPGAGLWVSNQGFTPEQNDVFFGYIAEKRPTWLRGVVFGPWAKISIDEMRRRTPEGYGIRQYPDICHTLRCQFPVPDWDLAFARTLGREPFNPRPEAMARIQAFHGPGTVGSLTYSDGITDDVNKMIWTAREWDESADLDTLLTEYGNYFYGGGSGAAAAQGLRALETNWEGPLLTHRGVLPTLEHWRAIDGEYGANAPSAWRLKLALFRAIYDAYVQRRLVWEHDRESRAMDALRKAGESGALSAVKRARAELARADDRPEAIAALRKELLDLGRFLYDDIGLQFDVANYKANSIERGAVLEYLDEPLNDRVWLESRFVAIEAEGSEEARLAYIKAILEWERPGPGGYYDDLGNPQKQPRLVPGLPWKDDPGRVHSAEVEFTRGPGGRLSWTSQTQTLFGTPLRMRYEGLDPDGRYRLRVTYAGRYGATMRLDADDGHEVHGPLAQPDPVAPQEFSVDPALTADGRLELEWTVLEGRGCQVAEVWLVPER